MRLPQHINWIIGTERRAKVDFKVHPRGDEDRRSAEQKTKLLKYLSDVNKAPHHRSRAFEEAAKAGLSWIETGIRSDPTMEPLFYRHESWRNCWYDHLARDVDRLDERYFFRARWVDLDVAKAMFPDRKAVLQSAAVAAEQLFPDETDDLDFPTAQYDYQSGVGGMGGSTGITDSFHIGIRRARVRLIECWYREPHSAKVMRSHSTSEMAPELAMALGKMNGRDAPEGQAEGLAMLMGEGYVSIHDAIRMDVFCGIFCSKGMLQDMKSPYNHRRIPFTPVVIYRRGRDNTTVRADQKHAGSTGRLE